MLLASSYDQFLTRGAIAARAASMTVSISASLLLASLFSTCASGSGAQPPFAQERIPLNTFDYQEACPDYTQYSTYPHRPLSDGPLALPFQRPDPRCRTFHSDAIEQVIQDVTSRMKDPDLARLFENAFPVSATYALSPVAPVRLHN